MTTRRDPDSWTKVYGFKRGIKEGWAGRGDGLAAGKFKGEINPKEGLHPANCVNSRERRMTKFMMPILHPEKPKRVTLTVANTLFRAISGVRPVNWRVIIHEIVARGISQIGKKPSYISPFIMHLYEYHHCTTVDEDDKLLSGKEKILYKLQPVQHRPSSEGDPPFLEAPHLHPKVLRKVSGEPALHLPLLHTILLHIVHLNLHMLLDLAGLPWRHPGKTWIYPRGSFRKTPSNGCFRT